MEIGGVSMTIRQLSESGNEELRERLCPSGHGLITLTGDLGCCTVCGRQRDKDCNRDHHPCDDSVGLQCVYESKKVTNGVCKRKYNFETEFCSGAPSLELNFSETGQSVLCK